MGFRLAIYVTLMAVSLVADQSVDYKWHSVFRFTPAEHQLNQLNTYLSSKGDQVELLSNTLISNELNDVRVSEDERVPFMDIMKVLSIDYERVSSDLQADIDREREEIEETSNRVKRTSLHFDFYNYHPFHQVHLTTALTQIVSYLKHFCSISQQECKSYSIGKSYEGKPLYVIQLGRPSPDKKVVWLDGGIHAREWITPATVINILHLLSRKNEVTDDLLKNHVFYILAVLNPDGYSFSWTKNRMWRKNRTPVKGSKCIGVDLNRNWGFLWGAAGTSNNPCSNIYHGRSAFTEPETKAVSDFILKTLTPTKNFRLFLSLHSNSQKWLVPYAVSRTNRPKNLKNLIFIANKGRAAQRAQGLEYGIATPYTRRGATAGQSYDWAKGAADATYSYILELPLHNHYGFMLPKRYIEPVMKQTWAALKMVLNEIEKLENRKCVREF